MSQELGEVPPFLATCPPKRGRLRPRRGDLYVDILAALVQPVEADSPGHGARFGYQLLIEIPCIADWFRPTLLRRHQLAATGRHANE